MTAPTPNPSRRISALAALWIAILGALFLGVLVANWSDNAYIGLALLGVDKMTTFNPVIRSS